MGMFLNPGAQSFLISRNTRPYVDKSMLIDRVNEVVNTEKRYVCVSRPRRFGKTMATNMLSAYYERDLDAWNLFQGLNVVEAPSFSIYANRFNVIKLNMQEFLSESDNISDLVKLLSEDIEDELFELYPDANKRENRSLPYYMQKAFSISGIPFVIIVDEWDCIFREYPHDEKAQEKYLDFLRDFFKDRNYIAFCYMTGILPIKKYGTHSALNMFTEYSMENQGNLAEFTGFTEEEVSDLCRQYNADMDLCRQWYDGYSFPKCAHIYNPKSIDAAVTSGIFDDYWNKTETYEALKIYIDMNFDGLRDSIIKMLAGGRQKIDTGSFQNDMTSFSRVDDVLTLLIHLGYLGYDFDKKEVFIPNTEIADEFITATTVASGWDEIARAVRQSENLLQATWNGDEEHVAQFIEDAHLETSHLQYNDENALSYTISLAYYAARQYYTVIRELPTGKGFADLSFIPRRRFQDKPAMLIELKWDQSADTAISQIHRQQYLDSLKDYQGNLIVVGINYDKKSRTHICKIEKP